MLEWGLSVKFQLRQAMQIQAVFESGLIRPLEPVELPEGELIEVIVLQRKEKADGEQTPVQILARIAALPLEGATDNFSGQDHDRILYPANE
jgi:predicted DNA-binding antitoxin AbrB/MazE fold protein